MGRVGFGRVIGLVLERPPAGGGLRGWGWSWWGGEGLVCGLRRLLGGFGKGVDGVWRVRGFLMREGGYEKTKKEFCRIPPPFFFDCIPCSAKGRFVYTFSSASIHHFFSLTDSDCVDCECDGGAVGDWQGGGFEVEGFSGLRDLKEND